MSLPSWWSCDSENTSLVLGNYLPQGKARGMKIHFTALGLRPRGIKTFSSLGLCPLGGSETQHSGGIFTITLPPTR